MSSMCRGSALSARVDTNICRRMDALEVFLDLFDPENPTDLKTDEDLYEETIKNSISVVGSPHNQDCSLLQVIVGR